MPRSQKAIFQNLYTEIPKMFPFVISESNLEVISGKQEGVYAWIAVNYVLHKFDHGADGTFNVFTRWLTNLQTLIYLQKFEILNILNIEPRHEWGLNI